MKKTATPEPTPERFAVHAVVTITPRLLDVGAAASYLGGVSVSTVRSWIKDKLITPVNLPGVKQSLGRAKKETNRRLLFDRIDLDAFVEGRREP